MLLDALITVVQVPWPWRACGRRYSQIRPPDHSDREGVVGVRMVPTYTLDILTHGSPPPEREGLSRRWIHLRVEEIHGFLPVKVLFQSNGRPRRQSRGKPWLQGRSRIDLPCTLSGREITALATGNECAVTLWKETDLPCTAPLQGKQGIDLPCTTTPG